MYIVIKTDEPEKINITTKGQQKLDYYYTESLDSKASKNIKLNTASTAQKTSEKDEFIDYLRQSILEPNKLSDEEIKKLSFEYYSRIDCPSRKDPVIKIGLSSKATAFYYYRFNDIFEQFNCVAEQYNQAKNIKDFKIDINKDLGIVLPSEIPDIIYQKTACGVLNERFYKLLYYFDFLKVPIYDKKLKRFWKFYKKTMNVYAMGLHYYSTGTNEICVVPKPNEIFIDNGITHCIYENNYYCNGVRVPQWIYKAKKENIEISDFYNIKNADVRSTFIKKAGMENFINLGEVIDTYENYPENEWWAKSEYKLIDMSKLFVKKVFKNLNTRRSTFEYYDYAPFLCMKNQTTGEYHLEGVSPNCKDLYDAIKMRYKNLDLPSYEIKDIK